MLLPLSLLPLSLLSLLSLLPLAALGGPALAALLDNNHNNTTNNNNMNNLRGGAAALLSGLDAGTANPLAAETSRFFTTDARGDGGNSAGEQTRDGAPPPPPAAAAAAAAAPPRRRRSNSPPLRGRFGASHGGGAAGSRTLDLITRARILRLAGVEQFRTPSWETHAANFPYHALETHGRKFAAGAMKYLERSAPSASRADMIVAFFWGIAHDYGYTEAVAAQTEYDACPQLDVLKAHMFGWGSKDSCGLSHKLGRDHEMFSIKKAVEVIRGMKDRAAAGDKDDQAIAQVLSEPINMLAGRAMVASTKMGPPNPDILKQLFFDTFQAKSAYGEEWAGVHAVGGGSPHENVWAATDYEALTAALEQHLRAGGPSLEQWKAAGEHGDFHYMTEELAVCQCVNVFAEFFAYGGVDANTMPVEPIATSLHDQWKKFWKAQKGFTGFVVKGKVPGNDAKLEELVAAAEILADWVPDGGAAAFPTSLPELLQALAGGEVDAQQSTATTLAGGAPGLGECQIVRANVEGQLRAVAVINPKDAMRMQVQEKRLAGFAQTGQWSTDDL
jgi:hypothetical protein